MAKGIFQSSYKVVDSNFNLIMGERVKVGDKLKSIDTTTRELVDVEVKKIISAQSLPSIYIETYEPRVGFVLAKGFSFHEDGFNQLVSHDSTLSSSNYNVITQQWFQGIPVLAHCITENNARGIRPLDNYSDPNQEAIFISWELVSGENIFITPDDQRLEPFSINI